MSGVQMPGKPTVVASGPGWVEDLVFKSKGYNIPTVAQIYLNNGSSIGDEKNNTLYTEGCLPSTPPVFYGIIEVSMQMRVELPLNFRVFIKLTNAVSAGWYCNEVDLPSSYDNHGAPVCFSNTVCSLCKAPAYLGFNQIECHNSNCRNYKP